MLAKMQIKKQPILIIYKFCVQNLKELAAFFIMLNFVYQLSVNCRGSAVL